MPDHLLICIKISPLIASLAPVAARVVLDSKKTRKKRLTGTKSPSRGVVGPLGAETHYHATVAGKEIAAFLPPEQRAALLSRLNPSRLTERTLTRYTEIEREWAKVRKQGFALNDEETIVGAVFLAAPIFEARQSVCGSRSISIRKARYSEALGARIATRLKEVCHRPPRNCRRSATAQVIGAPWLEGMLNISPSEGWPFE